MVRSESRSRLIAFGAIGVVVFVIGVVVASLRLPEWRNRSLPDQSFFAGRLQTIVPSSALQIESAPRITLHSKPYLYDNGSITFRETAYEILGPRAADWLAAEGRGPFVGASARSRWRTTGEEGQIRILFSTRGQPVSAMWLPDKLSLFSRPGTITQRGNLDRTFLSAGQGTQESELSVMNQTMRFTAMPGSAPPETLISLVIEGVNAPNGQRVTGSVDWWRNRFESITLGTAATSQLQQYFVRTLFVIAVLVLFITLLMRRRIELSKGAILAALSIALSLPGPLWSSTTPIQVLDTVSKVLAKAVALFIIWSAAESWLRSTVPGFRTSLDTLRAGRLGPKGGKALLTGWSIGAAAAGLMLMAISAGTMVPGVSPTDGSVTLPILGTATSPIDEGAFRTGLVMLVICCALRWPLLRRLRGGATVLGALVMANRIPLSSFWIAFVAGLLLTAVLVFTYAEFGLTALLTAAMMSAVLPAALFSLMHFSWMPVSAVMMVFTAIAPIPLGLIGIRRDDEAEEGPLPLPGFARRLEEENRLKYEMDLLARMQLGLLPKEMPVVDGYEIAAHSILATEAGGDLYDFVGDSNGRIWIAAGDVSGHGYSCAIAQAMTKAGLASLVDGERTPASVLQRLDIVLRGIGAPRTFTSMVLLRLDPGTGQALLSNAGHPYPWIVDKDGVRELDLPSLPLGQGPSRQYGDLQLAIKPGMAIVLFSDGLFEAGDTHGRPYGFDRLRQLLDRVSPLAAPAIVTAIVDDWRAHAGPGAPADDTTIVVVKRNHLSS